VYNYDVVADVRDRIAIKCMKPSLTHETPDAARYEFNQSITAAAVPHFRNIVQ
jgi:hypothetical protein